MLVLALDTSFSNCSVALWRDGAVLARASRAMGRGHAEALVPMIRDVAAQAGVSIADVDRIGVTVGPGTFTGIRIGLAAAHGLGLARGCPVVGITTLEAVARGVQGAARETHTLVVALDAGRPDLYVQRFGPGGTGQGDIVALKPGDEILGLSGPVLLAGNGAAPLASMLAEKGCESLHAAAPGLPDAALVAEIAAERDPASPRAAARPLYIHPTYAKLPETKPVKRTPRRRATTRKGRRSKR